MSSEPRDYLRHIAAEADYLLECSASLTFDTFSQDQTLRRAFVRSLEIIGEASKKVPEEFRARHHKSSGAPRPACAIDSFTTTSASTTTWSGTWCAIAFRSCVLKSRPCLTASWPLQLTSRADPATAARG